MSIPLRPIIEAAAKETTDEMLRKMQKSAKLIARRGVKVTFVETASTELDGEVQWDKNKNIRVVAKAGGIIPVSSVPVNAEASGGLETSFQAEGTMDVKIRVESMVRVEPM